MAVATCRCGQALEMPPQGSEHTTCPRCSAKVRIVRKRKGGDPSASSATNDGFLRFSCPCGRRLKVSAIDRPSHGKCPDCGTIVPVPVGAGATSSKSDSPTEELATADVAMLAAWSKGHLVKGNGEKSHGTANGSTAEMPLESPGRRAEAGFRVCPRCGKPIHLNAESCRACGTPVPKR